MFSFSFAKSLNASNHVCSHMVPVWNHSSFNSQTDYHISQMSPISLIFVVAVH